MKAIWTGAIGFGLVNIPVKMYAAVESSSLDLDMLDKKDLSHIRFLRVNEHTGREVAWENIIKGYKYNDKYVVLTDEDFEKASPEKTKSIDIKQFVDEAGIESIYYETPYYLEPGKGGAKAYTLLKEALKKTGKAGLGSFVMRARESLCIVKCFDDILVLNKIRFETEIRPAKDLKIPAASIKPAEMKMAISLIESLSEPFDISAYRDTYSDKLMALIKAKAKGAKIKTPAMRVVHSDTMDLMAQLKASLGGKRKKAG
jgi:DNA end-binding protein Ku